MGIYMYLYCKDCKEKADFTSGSSWLGDAPESVLIFMGKHSSHDIGIFSENNSLLWGGEDDRNQPCKPDPLVIDFVNQLNANPNSPLAEATKTFRERFHKIVP